MLAEAAPVGEWCWILLSSSVLRIVHPGAGQGALSAAVVALLSMARPWGSSVSARPGVPSVCWSSSPARAVLELTLAGLEGNAPEPHTHSSCDLVSHTLGT